MCPRLGAGETSSLETPMAATTKAKKSLLSQAKELSHSNRPILARHHGKNMAPTLP